MDESRFHLKLRAFSLKGGEIESTTGDLGELVISEADKSFFLRLNRPTGRPES